MESGAVFSPCDRYRYALWRLWDTGRPPLLVVGLNPSTADARRNDPTVRRCLGYAGDWGWGGLLVANLFAYRATHPAALRRTEDPEGVENDHWLHWLAGHAGQILVAWGNGGRYRERGRAVRAALPQPLFHLGLTQLGEPRHPLYVPAAALPQPWS
jgi:hypothetical protein